MIDPELTLNDQQRQELATCTQLRGFEHIKQLALAECGRFDVQLKNLDPASANYDSTLRQYHALSKAASQFWVGLVERINREVAALEIDKRSKKRLKDLRPQDIEKDPTEDLLRVGEAEEGET